MKLYLCTFTIKLIVFVLKHKKLMKMLFYYL